MDVVDKLERIKRWYAAHDTGVRKRYQSPFFDTPFGIWGASDLNDAFLFFSKIRLERFRRFADYGSGDGRIVLAASLFTDATGIEGDVRLHAVAERARRELAPEIPEISRTEFKNKNYYDERIADYDLIFFFADHEFPSSFITTIKNEFKGYLVFYNRLHLPHGLTRGKTYWIQQIPLATYPVNVDEEDLFSESPAASTPPSTATDEQQEKHDDNQQEEQERSG